MENIVPDLGAHSEGKKVSKTGTIPLPPSPGMTWRSTCAKLEEAIGGRAPRAGSRLTTEIAQRFGVSRTPSEAFRLMAANNTGRIARRQGATVRVIKAETLIEMLPGHGSSRALRKVAARRGVAGWEAKFSVIHHALWPQAKPQYRPFLRVNSESHCGDLRPRRIALA